VRVGFQNFVPPTGMTNVVVAIDDVAVEPDMQPIGKHVPGVSAGFESSEALLNFKGHTTYYPPPLSSLASQFLYIVCHQIKNAEHRHKTDVLGIIPHSAKHFGISAHLTLVQAITKSLGDVNPIIVGDMGGGWAKLVTTLMSSQKFSTFFKTKDVERIEHPALIYSSPKIDGIYRLFGFDAPHISRNICRTFCRGDRFLTLYENGPLVTSSHLISILGGKTTGEKSFTFTVRCFSGKFERQDTDAANLIFSLKNALAIANILGNRGGATALFIKSASSITTLFTGWVDGCRARGGAASTDKSVDTTLIDMFAGIRFFRHWKSVIAGSSVLKQKQNFITNDSYVGLEILVSMVVLFFLQQQCTPIRDLRQLVTLLLENLFSHLRGGSGVGYTGTSLTPVLTLYRTRDCLVIEQFYRHCYSNFGVSPPSRKSKASLAYLLQAGSERVSRHLDLSAYIADMYAISETVFVDDCKNFLGSENAETFLAGYGKAAAASATSPLSQSTYDDLIKIAKVEADDSHDNDDSASDISDDASDDDDDETELLDDSENPWCFHQAPTSQHDHEHSHRSQKPNDLRATLKREPKYTAGERAVRGNRFRDVKATPVPQCIRCYCFDPKRLQTCSSWCQLKLADLQGHHLALARTHVSLGESIKFDGQTAVVDRIVDTDNILRPCCFTAVVNSYDPIPCKLFLFLENSSIRVVDVPSTKIVVPNCARGIASASVKERFPCVCKTVIEKKKKEALYVVEKFLDVKRFKGQVWWTVKWAGHKETTEEADISIRTTCQPEAYRELVECFKKECRQQGKRMKVKIDYDKVDTGY